MVTKRLGTKCRYDIEPYNKGGGLKRYIIKTQ